MRKLFAIFACIMFLAACKKDSTNKSEGNSTSETVFKFKVNGVLYQNNSPYTGRREPSFERDDTYPEYILDCMGIPNSDGSASLENRFGVVIHGSPLTAKKYNPNEVSENIIRLTDINFKSYTINLTFIFSRVSSNTADGTFSGTAVGLAGETITITEGVFKNIKVID